MKRHMGSLTMLAITVIAMVVVAFIETPIQKFSLILATLVAGWCITLMIAFFEEPLCGRHNRVQFRPRTPRPTVREFGWGIPIVGPQDGPPCNECGAATIVARGPCVSLHWCADCRKNVLPGLAPTTTTAA